MKMFKSPKILKKLLYWHSQKMKSSIKDLVTFTEEIHNGQLHFLCSLFTVLITKQKMNYIIYIFKNMFIIFQFLRHNFYCACKFIIS